MWFWPQPYSPHGASGRVLPLIGSDSMTDTAVVVEVPDPPYLPALAQFVVAELRADGIQVEFTRSEDQVEYLEERGIADEVVLPILTGALGSALWQSFLKAAEASAKAARHLWYRGEVYKDIGAYWNSDPRTTQWMHVLTDGVAHDGHFVECETCLLARPAAEPSFRVMTQINSDDEPVQLVTPPLWNRASAQLHLENFVAAPSDSNIEFIWVERLKNGEYLEEPGSRQLVGYGLG